MLPAHHSPRTPRLARAAQITYIPPEALAGCVTLRQLLLQSTRLSAWPLPLPPMCPYGQLGQLRELSLRGCSGLGYGCIRSAVPFAACPGLTRLDLSGASVTCPVSCHHDDDGGCQDYDPVWPLGQALVATARQ